MVADTSQFERKMLTANRIMGGVGKAGFFMGLGAAGGIAVVTKAAGDFQEEMNVLQAVTGVSNDKLAKMRDEAMKLGADLKLPNTSAKDAADAMLELSKGGLSVHDTMAAARGTIQLATAAQIDNATAAKIQARALQAFGLDGSHASKIADQMANATNASTLEFDDLALGIQQASAQFHATQQPIDALNTSLAIMANHGIAGSDAGTSLRVMMQRLNPQTKKAKEMMDHLGVSVYDAHGNYKPLEQIIESFSGKLDKLNPKQRQHALYTIFGADATRAANIVLGGGVKQYDKMHEKIVKTGTAQKIANAHTKGFNGAMQGFISQIQTAEISIGTLFLPIMTKFVRALGIAAGWLAKNPKLAKVLLTVILGLGVALTALVATYKIYMGVTKLAEFYQTLFGKSLLWTRIQLAALWVWQKLVTVAQWAMNVAMEANPIGLVVIAVIALIAGLVLLYKHSGTFREMVGALWDKLKEFASWIKDIFVKTVPKAFEKVKDWFKAHWKDAVVLLVGGPFLLLLKKANDAFGLVGKIKSAFHTVMDKIREWGSDFIGFIRGLPDKIWNAAKKIGSKLKDGLVAGVTGLAHALGQAIAAALNTVISLWNNLHIPGFHKTISVPLGPDVSIGWGDIALPDLPTVVPRFREGGIILGPTLAVVGDNASHREAVVPLPDRGGLMGGGDTYVQVTVEGSVLTDRDLETKLLDVLSTYGRRNGRVRLAVANSS